MTERHGSPRFYKLTQSMRSNIEEVAKHVHERLTVIMTVEECSAYDAAVELITEHLHSLSDMRTIEIQCLWIASLAMAAAICHKANHLVNIPTLIDGMLEWLDKMDNTHSIKNHDYASEHPLSNFMAYCAPFDMPLYYAGIIISISKKERLRSIKHKGCHKVNETVEETLIDMAVYAFLIIIMYETEQDGWDREKYRRLAWEYLND